MQNVLRSAIADYRDSLYPELQPTETDAFSLLIALINKYLPIDKQLVSSCKAAATLRERFHFGFLQQVVAPIAKYRTDLQDTYQLADRIFIGPLPSDFAQATRVVKTLQDAAGENNKQTLIISVCRGHDVWGQSLLPKDQVPVMLAMLGVAHTKLPLHSHNFHEAEGETLAVFEESATAKSNGSNGTQLTENALRRAYDFYVNGGTIFIHTTGAPNRSLYFAALFLGLFIDRTNTHEEQFSVDMTMAKVLQRFDTKCPAMMSLTGIAGWKPFPKELIASTLNDLSVRIKAVDQSQRSVQGQRWIESDAEKFQRNFVGYAIASYQQVVVASSSNAATSSTNGKSSLATTSLTSK